MLSNFFIIPVVREKIKVKLATAIHTAAPTTLTVKIIQTPPLVVLKTVKICLCNQKQQHVCLIFYCIFFFD